MEILYKGQKLTIGKYEAIVDRCIGVYYLSTESFEGGSDDLFKQFGLSKKDLDSKFQTDTSTQGWTFPPTKTLEELTKIYNYLKSFEENNYEIY